MQELLPLQLNCFIKTNCAVTVIAKRKNNYTNYKGKSKLSQVQYKTVMFIFSTAIISLIFL